MEILENGKLVKVADSDDLAKKIIDLAINEELKVHFSNISHQRIEVFDIRKFIQGWSRLIDYYVYNPNPLVIDILKDKLHLFQPNFGLCL